MSLALPSLLRPYAELDFTRFALDSRITFARSTQRTYSGPGSTLATAAVNECPLEYDPVTGLVLGRSFYEQRTNLILRSQEFDNAAWVTTATKTANALLAPDGTMTADMLTSTAAGQNTQAVVATATSHVFSVYLHVGNAALPTTQIILRNTTTATNLCIATVTFATMTVTGVGASIQNVGGGWYRVSASASAGITIGNTLTCYAGTFSAAGLTFYLWGAQCEAGLTPSPYIATTSATVTRGTDSAVLSDLTKLRFNPAGYTLFVDAYTSTSAAPAGLEAYLSLNDNTGNNRVMIRREANASILLLVNTGGVSQAGFTVAGPGANTRVKIAARIAANDFAMSVNGSAVATDNAGTLPAVTRMDIGSHLGGTMCSSPIRRIRVIPRALANAELQALAA